MKNTFYYWKDDTKVFRTNTPFVEDYKGLKSISSNEYAYHKISESRAKRNHRQWTIENFSEM